MDITNIITRYYKVTNHPTITHLRMELYYSKGGTNVWNSKTEPRGYYMSISPVKRERGTETYVQGTGLKKCIIEVQRKTKKKEEEAVNFFNSYILNFYKTHFSSYEIDIDSCEVR